MLNAQGTHVEFVDEVYDEREAVLRTDAATLTSRHAEYGKSERSIDWSQHSLTCESWDEACECGMATSFAILYIYTRDKNKILAK